MRGSRAEKGHHIPRFIMMSEYEEGVLSSKLKAEPQKKEKSDQDPANGLTSVIWKSLFNVKEPVGGLSS